MLIQMSQYDAFHFFPPNIHHFISITESIFACINNRKYTTLNAIITIFHFIRILIMIWCGTATKIKNKQKPQTVHCTNSNCTKNIPLVILHLMHLPFFNLKLRVKCVQCTLRFNQNTFFSRGTHKNHNFEPMNEYRNLHIPF